MQIEVLTETKLNLITHRKPEAAIECDAEVKPCNWTQVVAEREVDWRYKRSIGVGELFHPGQFQISNRLSF